jgi:hypothetical protein
VKILPHAQAPMYLNDSNPDRVFDEVVSIAESGHFSEGQMLEVFRQTSLVSLWFFLKIVAGAAGPFDKLNTSLHLSMCEFMQSTHEPGSRSAVFTGRFCFKSTICTIGDCAWSLLRNPDISTSIFSCTTDRSIDFLHTIQRIFDGNDLFATLFPSYVPPKNSKRWNDVEAVLPNRTKYQTSSSVGAFGVGCNTAGIHSDRIYIDDPVGDQQLNANRQSSAEMYKIANWLKSNLRTLVKGADSTISYAGTRYAIDDAHAFIFDSVKEKHGYWSELDEKTYKMPQDAEWRVYYRMVRENGKIIFPEAYSEEMLEKIRKEDPWTYWTQIQNHPQMSGLSELNNYSVKECELVWKNGDCLIKYYENNDGGIGTAKYINLADCYSVQAVDPASTEKYISAKTSRTAQGVLAHHASNKRFLISLHADYVAPTTLFDWLFSDAKKFKNYLSGTLLEAQGAFKILGPLLKEEERRRSCAALLKNDKPIYLNLRSITKTGEKDAVIRNTLQPLLEQELLYVEKSVKHLVLDELNIFPQSNKKDILDMWCLALNNTYRPESEVEAEEREQEEESWKQRVVNFAGY